MMYVVLSGLTRRLVEADSPRAARVIFLRDVPRGNLLAVPYEKCHVYEATAQDLIDFAATHKRHAVFDGQVELDLGDPRKPQKRRGKKERA